MKTWSVYLLRCSDGSLYCGATSNMARRLSRHAAGTAAKYTRGRGPFTLVAVRGELSKSAALKLEHRIKQLPAQCKVHTLSPSMPRLTCSI